ncbi:hypothetical protein, partial [Morganella morganii]|uniref:hypothetical protein n=1 Tax=Morganella morganii TaxID=582 RepID=UPI001F2C76DC
CKMRLHYALVMVIKKKALHSFVILNSGNYQNIISSNSAFSPLYYLRSTPINVQQQSQETAIIAGFLYDYLTEQNIDFDNLLSEKNQQMTMALSLAISH